METTTKPLTPYEKIQRLLDTKERVQREAKERYQNDPEIRAIVEEQRKTNAERFGNR